MRSVAFLIKKDFKRKWKSPFVIIGFLLIPVFFTFIFALVFGTSESDALPQITVLAADNDQSFLSEFFLSALGQGELKELIKLEKINEESGRKLLGKGKASTLLIIPKNFGNDVWEGRTAEISLLKNPSEQFLPQIAEEIIDTASLLFSALFSVFSNEITLIQGFVENENLSDTDISSLSIQIKNKIEGASKYVFPPIIALKQKTISDDKKDVSPLSVSGHILPAMGIMFLLFICNIVFEDVLKEKEGGTLLRMTVSPLKLYEFIWSKILTSVAIGMVCTAVLIISGSILFSIHWGNIVILLFNILSLNVLVAGFISVWYSFIKTERQAGAVLSTVILFMSMLGGSMVPVTQFPALLQKISRFTVNYWGIKAFQKNMTGEPVLEILPILVGMLLAGVCFAAAGAFFLNKNLRRGLIR